MTKPNFFNAAAALAVMVTILAPSASALSIKEFRKYPKEQQAVYISGAVSMIAYTHASNGDTARARCVQNWYFGEHKGDETPGPHQVALEIVAAENVDAERYAVEGVILGLSDKVCGQISQPTARSKP